MQVKDPNQTIGQAIQDFYDLNGFGEDGGMHEKIAWIKFGFFSVPIPNTETRRNNVYLHDINHLVTGYDTTWKGETAVSAWEIAAGGWKKLYFPWSLTLWAMGLGILVYPRNTFQAFEQGLTMNNALTSGLSKKELFNLSITDLRSILADKPKRKSSPYIWSAFSFLVFILPFIIILAVISGVILVG